MSRCYRWQGDRLVRRRDQDITRRPAAWEAARNARAKRRRAQGLDIQTRDGAGFIVKITPDGVVMYDPGCIDRELWVQAQGGDD